MHFNELHLYSWMKFLDQELILYLYSSCLLFFLLGRPRKKPKAQLFQIGLWWNRHDCSSSKYIVTDGVRFLIWMHVVMPCVLCSINISQAKFRMHFYICPSFLRIQIEGAVTKLVMRTPETNLNNLSWPLLSAGKTKKVNFVSVTHMGYRICLYSVV